MRYLCDLQPKTKNILFRSPFWVNLEPILIRAFEKQPGTLQCLSFLLVVLPVL